MKDIQTTDERQIANNVAIVLKQNGIKAKVFNFGEGSFQSSLEFIKFQDLLRRVEPNEYPSVVVFYDGFNDANHSLLFGAGNIQADVANKLRLLVERNYLTLAQYCISEFLLMNSALYRDYFYPLLEPSIIRNVRDGGPTTDNLRKSIAVTVQNIRMIKAVSHQMGIKPLFILQPLVVTKKGLTKFEKEFYDTIPLASRQFIQKFYTALSEILIDEPTFLDFSAILDNNQENNFYDLGHTGPYTSKKIGSAMGKAILSRLNVP